MKDNYNNTVFSMLKVQDFVTCDKPEAHQYIYSNKTVVFKGIPSKGSLS